MKTFLKDKVVLWQGDSREVLKGYENNSFDAIVCDPPYALVSIAKRFGKENAAPCQYGTDGAYQRASSGFMGQQWDTGETAFAVEFWQECFRVLKPGGHVLAFGGTRTYHRLACAIEDAGFEIRDMVQWIYGSGFPKSHNISKSIDRAAGVEREVIGKSPRHGGGVAFADGHGGFNTDIGNVTIPATELAKQWDGWGTALKPSQEPICMARKPLIGTVAENVTQYGTGGLNIDGCRVGIDEKIDDARLGGKGSWSTKNMAKNVYHGGYSGEEVGSSKLGRWPANTIHDGSEEVVSLFPNTKSGVLATHHSRGTKTDNVYGTYAHNQQTQDFGGDSGSAARFFYCPKANKKERRGSKHPTVKPVALMQYLCRLVTPPGGVILDPFAGSGTTGEAAWREGFKCHLIEREATYCEDIETRLTECALEDIAKKTGSVIRSKTIKKPEKERVRLPL